MKRPNTGLALRNGDWSAIENASAFTQTDFNDSGFGIELIASPRYCIGCNELIGFYPFPRKWHEECFERQRQPNRRFWMMQYKEFQPLGGGWLPIGEDSKERRWRKLTDEAVLDIRQNHRPLWGYSDFFFAEKYGVSPSTIYAARNGDTYRTLPDAHLDWSFSGKTYRIEKRRDAR